MRTFDQVGFLMLTSGTVCLLVFVGCGGKASTESNGPSVGLTGGYGSMNTGGYATAVGGSFNMGGFTFSSTGGAAPITGTKVPAIHRPQATSCVGVHNPPEPTNIMYPQYSSCARHSDCTAGVNGKCVNGIGMASTTYYCVYDTCATDADCDPGMICYCTATNPARCLYNGNCQTDGDCANSGHSFCSPSMGFDCGGYHSVDSHFCHTGGDTCVDDSDCTGSDYCNYDVYSGHWQCTAFNNNCIIG